MNRHKTKKIDTRKNTVNKRKLFISIWTEEEFKQDLLRGFKRAEAGLPPEEPIHKLFFTSESDLFKTLSPKRMELVRYLRRNGPLSCRRLAAQLNRSYANVHSDVQELLKINLVGKNREKKLIVPWDELNIAVPLAA